MYSGYLVKVGGRTLPMKYIIAGGYKATPKHRLDKNSDRNSEGGLIRDVLPNMPSSVSITFNCDTNHEWMEVSNMLYGAMTNEAEKKIPVTFYNPERDDYITEDMYWSDTDYTIDSVEGNTVFYDKITIDLTGY